MEEPDLKQLDLLIARFGKETEVEYVGSIWGTDPWKCTLEQMRVFLVGLKFDTEGMHIEMYGDRNELKDAFGSTVLVVRYPEGNDDTTIPI